VGRFRTDRVAELLRQFLSEEFRKLRDPRLQNITVNEVRVSKDCRYAEVFWSALTAVPAENVMGAANPEVIAEIEQALQGVAPLLRKKVGDSLDLRFTPELKFSFDDTIASGARIDALLREVGSKETSD